MKLDTRSITGLAMVAAVSYVIVLIMNAGGFNLVAAAPFLSYEAKDVILAIGGFIYGPLGALAAAMVVSFVEMLTVSGTGPIGFVMNFISSATFIGVAALIYGKMRTAKGAALGLIIGSLSMTASMLLWNYIVTPVYMNIPRTVVAGMLIPVFLPFNLIKAGLNSAIIILVYKPLITALRSAKLLPGRQSLDSRIPGMAAVMKNGEASDTSEADTGADGSLGKGKFILNKSLLAIAGLLLVGSAVAIFLLTRTPR